MAVGVVDRDQNVLYRDASRSTGQRDDELVDALEREIGEALEARPDAAAVGLGIPARSTASAASRSPPSTCRSPTSRSAT